MDNSNNSLTRAAELLREASSLIQGLATDTRSTSIMDNGRRTGAGLGNGTITSSLPVSATIPSAQSSALTNVSPAGGRLRYFTPYTIGSAQSTHNRSNLQHTPEDNISTHPQVARSEGSSPAPELSVIAEMRRNFQPYSRTPQRRQSYTSRSRVDNNRSRLHESSFTRSVLCLGGPYETVTPGANRRSILAANGLGQTMITLNRCLTRQELENAIRAEFPKLNGCSFEVLRAVGCGQGKPIDRLSRSHAIPPIEMWISIRSGILYIRPVTAIFPPDEDTPEPETSTRVNSDEEVMEVDTLAPDSPANSRARSLVGATNSNTSDAHCSSSLQQASIQSIAATNTSTATFASEDVQNQEGESSSCLMQDITSMDEYRENLFRSAPGFQHILITRDLLLEEMLGIYLKDPTFNFNQRTMVKFVGEPGRDVSALSKEYFTLGIAALKTANFYGNHSLLEGEMDYLLPTRDPLLKSSGYYRFLGKFMGHSAVHFGIAFIGFSCAAVRYIFARNEMNCITLTASDIPDYDARQIMLKLTAWADGTEPDDDDKERIRYALQECNILDAPCRQNLRLLEQQYIEWHVVTSRATFLDEIRDGFKQTGFYEFVKEREYLWTTLFPTESSMSFSPNDVIRLISYDAADAIPTHIEEAILEFVTELDSKKIRDLLQCWTGSPSLPSDGLEVKVVEEGRFVVHACFNQIEIPRDITKTELMRLLSVAINYGVYGFGDV